MKRLLLSALLLLHLQAWAQNKLSFENVQQVQVRNSGAITEGEQVRGYYLFYQSDKVDRKNNEYVLQIMDQNTNPVKEVKFVDKRDIVLLDAEYNGQAICFMFLDEDKKELQFRVYDLQGKQKSTYVAEMDRNDLQMMMMQASRDNSGNNSSTVNLLAALPNHGFVVALPRAKGMSFTTEFRFMNSDKQREWVFVPELEDKLVQAMYLGTTDSVVYYELGRKKGMMAGKSQGSLMAVNFKKNKQDFLVDDNAFDSKYRFMPLHLYKNPATGQVELTGNYYDLEANLAKDAPMGMAFLTVDSRGKTVSKQYNSWAKDFGRYLTVNENGKLEEVGYLCIQDIQRLPDGSKVILTEGYKRNFDGLGTAMKIAGMGGGVTKIEMTDLVMLEFDANNKVRKAKIYPKKHYNFQGAMVDMVSQHALASYLKYANAFAYDFTTAAADGSDVTFCYSDYERSDEYKGGTFNMLRYKGGKLTEDKIPTKSKASFMRIMPAKPGFIAIMEYYKKEKRLDFRLEKVG
jgi:hypothetical protein